MARVAGVDPGTVGFDFCGLDGERVILDRSLPTDAVAADPDALIRPLTDAGPFDLIAGPSGYGLPLVPIDRCSPLDWALAYLPRGDDDRSGILGLRRLVEAMRRARLPVVFTPGVIHLPSVPAHRKANRIDMGTADKVCSAALAIDEQAARLGIPYAATSFVLVELGGAFSAVLAVQDGRIVDGLGGSSGPLGYRALGAMDGELAYLLGGFSKRVLFSGGATGLAGAPDLDPERLGARTDAAAAAAREAFLESVVKAVAAEVAIVPEVREVVLSGRLSRVGWIAAALGDRLSRLAPVRTLRGFAAVAKEAAQGAALVADGLAGGRRQGLVDAMHLRGASGTVLDHLYVEGSERIREELERRAAAS